MSNLGVCYLVLLGWGAGEWIFLFSSLFSFEGLVSVATVWVSCVIDLR